jgi:hypothetical protein
MALNTPEGTKQISVNTAAASRSADLEQMSKRISDLEGLLSNAKHERRIQEYREVLERQDKQ